MPLFYYQAYEKDNEIIRGKQAADCKQEVVDDLIQKNLTPISITQKDLSSTIWEILNSDLNGKKLIKKTDLLSITKEFSTLLKAGVDVEYALSMMVKFSNERTRKKTLTEVLTFLQNGESLASSMEKCSVIFPKEYTAVIRAGESSGQLKDLLSHLETALEDSIEVRSEIRTSLIYPSFLFFAASIAIVILLAVVLPGFREIFNGSNVQLPESTAALLNSGEWLQKNAVIIFSCLLTSILLVYLAFKNVSYRLHIDAYLLKLPILGLIFKEEATAQFSTIMGTLITGGINLSEAMTTTQDTLQNSHVRKCLSNANQNVKDGHKLSSSLIEENIFPEYALRLLSAGEETGKLADILFEIGKIYSAKLKQRLKNLVALIVPVMISVFGIIIGVLIYALLTAVLSLNELAF